MTTPQRIPAAVESAPEAELDDRVRGMIERGELGGRTVRIIRSGEVECAAYPLGPLPDGAVRVRTLRSAISPGTEMTFYGRDATNVYLHKRWDEGLRIFRVDEPTLEYPVFFGYRAMGVVVESRSAQLPEGARLYGNWRHTESVVLPAEQALTQRLPDELTDDDGVDIAQMGPICINAVAFAEGLQIDAPVVVFGAGPVGLITAQAVRASGAAEVVVIDRIASRLAIAESLGLRPIDATALDDVAAELKTEFGAEGIPVAFECTGSSAALNEAIRVVRRRGTVVAVGFYQGAATELYLGEEFHHNGIRVVCGQIGNIHPSLDQPTLRQRTIDLVRESSLRLGALPRLTLPVEKVAEGFAALKRPADVLQVVLTY